MSITASSFRKGTRGWALDVNREQIRRMETVLAGIRVGDYGSDARIYQAMAVDALAKLAESMSKELMQQYKLHAEELA